MLRRLVLALLALALALALSLGAVGVAPAHPEPWDIDGDNVANESDNCPSVYNVDQADADADGVGNRCDNDFDQDGDGIANGYPTRIDNCPTAANPLQEPSSTPGVGAACAVDTDGDTIFDFEDNCRAIFNRFQNNLDVDDLGDACDPDIDGDDPRSPADLSNEHDNCPTVFNPDQLDADKDGIGALCDADDVPAAAAALVGGGVAGGPSTTTPGAGGPADTTKPTVTLRVVGTQRFDEIRAGLVVGVRCSEACSVTARLTVGAQQARRLKLPRGGRVASGSAQLAGAASTYAFVRFTTSARRTLFRQRKVRTTLTVTAFDRAGNRRTVVRAVTLRR